MGEGVKRRRRVLLIAWLVLAMITIYVFRSVLYYARAVATTGRWYDCGAVTRLTPTLFAVPFLLLILGKLAPTRWKLLLALSAPFLVSALFLEAAALLAGNPSVHDAFGLAVALFITAGALYGLATQLARGEGA